MAKWLTQEWLDEGLKLAEGQPERPGASAQTAVRHHRRARGRYPLLLGAREREAARIAAR